MKSDLPKGMHRVCGLPIVELVVRALRATGVERICVVVGHGGEAIVDHFGDTVEYAWQTEQLGTGHAVKMAMPLFSDFQGDIIVTPGDTPLLNGDVLRDLVREHASSGAAATVATFRVDDPSGYGRIVRGPDGEVRQIVEHKDADPATLGISEVNSGVFCFDREALDQALRSLRNDNAQGEYYLPDCVRLISEMGKDVVAAQSSEPDAFRGVNDRWQLAEADAALRKQILMRHALSGVTIADPATTYVGFDVEIGQDTVLQPLTMLEGKTKIGSNCRIGPNSKVTDSEVGDGCEILMSHVNRAKMAAGSRCGPFANLRPGAVLDERVKIGNFVEVKNAHLQTQASVSHLSYIGDGKVGPRTNIGAGTIFCNYDGYAKHRTEIGADAFIGSNTTLVAPVTIGDGAMVAAGSVITKAVPDDALAIGRGRQENKEAWAKQWRNRKTEAGPKQETSRA